MHWVLRFSGWVFLLAAGGVAASLAVAAGEGEAGGGSGLTFEVTRLVLTPKPGAARVGGEFVFRNAGEKEVTIETVETTCGCTAAELERKVYAPGEEGRLGVGFTVGYRRGRQTSEVVVRTDGGRQVLSLVVELPERTGIAPGLLLYRGGEEGPKGVRVTFTHDLPRAWVGVEVRVTEGEGKFGLSDEEAKETGVVWEFAVWHRGEAGARSTGQLVVRTRGASGHEYEDRVFLRHVP